MKEKIVDKNVYDEICNLFRNDDKQVGATFRLMEEGITAPSELVKRGAAKNPGVISHHKVIIKAVRDGEFPESANLATYSVRTINRFLQSSISVSEKTKEVLHQRKASLQEIANNSEAVKQDTKELIEKSTKLDERLTEIKNAIYVYTFPTYYRVGVDGDSEIKWLKIGKTTSSVWSRVSGQNRQTVMPEDPIVIRIYHKEGIDLDVVEAKFHDTLKRMFHQQSSLRNSKAGVEWFATSEDSLDAIAELLELEIEEIEFDSLDD